MKRTAGKRHVTSLDRHVAQQIKLFRIRAGISREQLGHALGISFQQIQKYESGGNRVTIGRLGEIAGVLGVPISSFISDQTIDADISGDGTEESPFHLDSSAMKVAVDFTRIPSPRARRLVGALVATLASERDLMIGPASRDSSSQKKHAKRTSI